MIPKKNSSKKLFLKDKKNNMISDLIKLNSNNPTFVTVLLMRICENLFFFFFIIIPTQKIV